MSIFLIENNLPSHLFIRSNLTYFQEVISELLINAIKYSQPDTLISVFFTIESSKLKITILNKPFKYGNKEPEGIKDEYINLIFEPFFRIEKSITEESLSLNYGLGLTKVKMILQRMDATIQVSNFNDYSGNTPSLKVGFTISFPIVSWCFTVNKLIAESSRSMVMLLHNRKNKNIGNKKYEYSRKT